MPYCYFTSDYLPGSLFCPSVVWNMYALLVNGRMCLSRPDIHRHSWQPSWLITQYTAHSCGKWHQEQAVMKSWMCWWCGVMSFARTRMDCWVKMSLSKVQSVIRGLYSHSAWALTAADQRSTTLHLHLRPYHSTDNQSCFHAYLWRLLCLTVYTYLLLFMISWPQSLHWAEKCLLCCGAILRSVIYNYC